MKKIKLKQKLLCVSLLFACLLQAQLDKKTWLVGGNLAYFNYNYEYFSTVGKDVQNVNSLVIDAKIGYFVIDKFVVGISPSVSSYKIKNNQESISSNTKSFSLGPFMRYYFLKKDKNYNVVIETNYQIEKYFFNTGVKSKSISNEFNVFAGPVIYFNSSVGMEFLLGYFSKHQKDDYNYDVRKQENGLQFAIGLQIHLDKLNN